MVWEFIAQNWGWFAFLAVFLACIPLMRRLPDTQVIAKFIFKINSKRGIRMMDDAAARRPGFWTGVGDFAIAILFCGVGSAFVAGHAGRRGRQALLASLAFLSAFAYLGPTWVSFFPFAIVLQPNMLALLVSVLAGVAAYKAAPRLSAGKASLAAFILGTLFFSSPYLMNYAVTGSLTTLAIGLMVGTLGLPTIIISGLTMQAGSIATGASDKPGINIGYPSVENGNLVLKYSGTDIQIPFFPDIFLAFVLMLVLHEGFHGLVARAQKIPIKNTGLLFASIVPLGAFVEPDEGVFKKTSPVKRMRVYAAGSFANIFVVAFAAFLLGGLMVISGSVASDGFVVGNVIAGTPADGAFEPGQAVKSVDGVPMRSFDDFSVFMAGTRPGQNVTAVVGDAAGADKEVLVTLAAGDDGRESGFMGIRRYTDNILPVFVPYEQGLASAHLAPSPALHVFILLKWLFFLNLMLGLANLLPIKPFDGGFIYDALFSWAEGVVPGGRRLRLGKVLSKGFVLLIIVIFAVNLSPYVPF